MSKPVFTKPEAAAMQAQIAALNALVPTYNPLTGDTAQESQDIGALLWDAVTRLKHAAVEAIDRLGEEADKESHAEWTTEHDAEEAAANNARSAQRYVAAADLDEVPDLATDWGANP